MPHRHRKPTASAAFDAWIRTGGTGSRSLPFGDTDLEAATLTGPTSPAGGCPPLTAIMCGFDDDAMETASLSGPTQHGPPWCRPIEDEDTGLESASRVSPTNPALGSTCWAPAVDDDAMEMAVLAGPNNGTKPGMTLCTLQLIDDDAMETASLGVMTSPRAGCPVTRICGTDDDAMETASLSGPIPTYGIGYNCVHDEAMESISATPRTMGVCRSFGDTDLEAATLTGPTSPAGGCPPLTAIMCGFDDDAMETASLTGPTQALRGCRSFRDTDLEAATLTGPTSQGAGCGAPPTMICGIVDDAMESISAGPRPTIGPFGYNCVHDDDAMESISARPQPTIGQFGQFCGHDDEESLDRSLSPHMIAAVPTSTFMCASGRVLFCAQSPRGA